MHDFDPCSFLPRTSAAPNFAMPRANSVPSKSQIRTTSPAAKFAFATRHTRWQQALALLAQGQLRAVIHEQCALGMMEKRNPAFAALQLRWRCATNSVPSSSPARIFASTFFFLPDAMTSGMPERTAILAACIFDAMPPTAVSLSVPRAIFSRCGINFFDDRRSFSDWPCRNFR